MPKGTPKIHSQLQCDQRWVDHSVGRFPEKKILQFAQCFYDKVGSILCLWIRRSTAMRLAFSTCQAKIFGEEVFAGTNFCDLAFDHENHENFCFAKISRYTVLVNTQGSLHYKQGMLLVNMRGLVENITVITWPVLWWCCLLRTQFTSGSPGSWPGRQAILPGHLSQWKVREHTLVYQFFNVP